MMDKFDRASPIGYQTLDFRKISKHGNFLFQWEHFDGKRVDSVQTSKGSLNVGKVILKLH
jgi:hypothetical protein